MPHEKLPQEDEFWVGEGGEVYFNDDEFGPTELDEVQIVDGLNEGSRLRAALAAKDARIAELEKDRERLDWLWENCAGSFTKEDGEWMVTWAFPPTQDEDGWPDDIRAAIDAALSSRGEDA